MSRLGRRFGLAGAILGVVAGVVQWAFGHQIPDWTGDKLRPVQLGIITIVLSLIALGSVSYATRRADAPPCLRTLSALGMLIPAPPRAIHCHHLPDGAT